MAKPKLDVPKPEINQDLMKKVDELARPRYKEAVRIAEKTAREKFIDQVKADVAIWKREFYADGTAEATERRLTEVATGLGVDVVLRRAESDVL